MIFCSFLANLCVMFLLDFDDFSRFHAQIEAAQVALEV